MENGHSWVAIFYLFPGGEKRAPCGARVGDSKAVALQGAAGSRDVTESPSLRQDNNGKRLPSGSLFLLFPGGEK